jgi:hypothetical protein
MASPRLLKKNSEEPENDGQLDASLNPPEPSGR